MATIDSRKLLPAGRPGGAITESQKPLLVPISNVFYKKDVKISQKLLRPVDQEKESVGSLVVIKKKITKISDVIQSTYLIEQSENNRKRKERERQKSEEREKQLETRKPTKVNERNLAKVSIPGRSILDTINRFIGFTLLGYLFDKYNQFLPKLAEFSKLITPVAKFIEAFGKNVINRVIDFIDVGYQAYDKVRAEIKNIGGEGAQKTFDEFSTNLNKILNGAIGAAMLIAGTAPRSPKGVSGAIGAGMGAGRGYGYRPEPLTPGVKPGTTEGRAITKAQRDAARNAAKATRRTAGAAIRRGIAGETTEQAAKQLASQSAKQSLKSLVGVPVIGSLIGFIIDTVVFREKPTRAAAGAVGSALGQGIGIFLAGSTTFGLGAGIGMFVGGFVGDMLGKTIYDSLTGFNPEPIPAKAQGGQVSGGQSRVATSRRIKTTPRRTQRTYTPQKTQPGKDIGGKQKIEQLYGKDEPGQRSALRALRKSSEDLKKMRSLNGVAGAMFGAGIDMSLGQKPDRKLATSLGNTFGSVIQAAIDAELDSSFNDISRTIAMANGGVVPSREIKGGMSIGEKIGKYISSAFSIALESSAAKVLQNLNQEFNLEGGPPGGATGPVGPAGNVPGARIRAGSNAQIEADLLEYFTAIYGKNAAIGIVANIRRESGYRTATPDNSRFEGMVQWSRNDRWPKFVKWAEERGLDPYNRNVQAQYIAVDINNHGIDGELRSASSPEAAASIFYNKFERGAHSKPVKGNAYDPNNAHENLNKQFIADITGRNPNIGSRSGQVVIRPTPQAVAGNLKDTGLKDSSGRPIRLKGAIADAFIDMSSAARKDGIDLGPGISNAFRDPEHNARVGGAQGSRHLSGEAFDINWNSAAGKWIRSNASRFGFGYNPYSSQSTHFDWVGGYSPRSSSPTPKQTLPGRKPWKPEDSGLTYNKETGKWERASLAPSQQSREIASLQQSPSYALVENNTILYQKEFVLT